MSRHRVEQRELVPGEKEKNVILEFKPAQSQSMIIAPLWSDWKGAERELLSFGAITDDPPAEIA